MHSNDKWIAPFAGASDKHIERFPLMMHYAWTNQAAFFIVTFSYSNL